jgi:phosphoribosylanthranilate isomerase
MTVVKICGITTLEDAQAAVQAGADLLGFVFHPPSPRYVHPERVREIVDQMPARPRLGLVGVFVDREARAVAQILDDCRLDHAQLHGAEPVETVRTLIEGGFGVIKAFRVRDRASLAEINRYQTAAYLLDSYVPGELGGTGHRFDWGLVGQAKGHGPIILAGGLTPDNVKEAISVARPWGVDVSSGVEAAPGRKDHGKLRRFVTAAKSSDQGIQ